MPSIGARFYTQLDSAYLWGDMVEGELEKVINQSESSTSKLSFRKLRMDVCFGCCASWARLTSVRILAMWRSTVKTGTSFSSGCFGHIYFDSLKRDIIGLSYRILLLLSTRWVILPWRHHDVIMMSLSRHHYIIITSWLCHDYVIMILSLRHNDAIMALLKCHCYVIITYLFSWM